MWLALLAAAALAPGCGGEGSPPTAGAVPTPAPTPTPELGPPSFVVVYADDLGYGDLSSFGHPAIRTPNIDRLAEEGARFTDFYSPVPICAPSRAALLTGRWPVRTGIPWNPPNGLHDGELTIAEVLKGHGYATAAVGKWHLGWDRDDMPIHHGFDYYYGIPSGTDESDAILGDEPTRDTVAPHYWGERYTAEAIAFIEEHPDQPFFVYLAHRDPHLPYLPAPEFEGTSSAGIYGDVVEQLDATVGTLMTALEDLGRDHNTLVIFASDNGPALPPKGAGSAGPLWGGKGSLQEGGIRVPAVARWPGRIPPGLVVSEATSTIDLLPTLVSLAGAPLPDRHYDGLNIAQLLTGEVDRLPGRGIDEGRELVFWYSNRALALRSGRWKYLRPGPWATRPTLYDLEADPGERNDLSFDQPEMVEQLDQRIDDIVAGR
jgi:arylsulfatase A-like enzyme